MTTVIYFIINQTIIRYTDAQCAIVDLDRENLTEEEILELRERRIAASEACLRIWKKVDKAAILEALECFEDYTAYANKLIALHGEGEAKEAAERYFEHSEGCI